MSISFFLVILINFSRSWIYIILHMPNSCKSTFVSKHVANLHVIEIILILPFCIYYYILKTSWVKFIYPYTREWKNMDFGMLVSEFSHFIPNFNEHDRLFPLSISIALPAVYGCIISLGSIMGFKGQQFGLSFKAAESGKMHCFILYHIIS